MLWKSLSLGKLVFMKMIFLVPRLSKIAILLLMMIPNLQYMMITMINMIFSVHLLSRKLIMITICLLYLMIMVMRIIMIARKLASAYSETRREKIMDVCPFIFWFFVFFLK